MLRALAIVLNLLLLGCAAVVLVPILARGAPVFIVLCGVLAFLAPAVSLIVLLLPTRGRI
jgi:hypothetical protein